jgi:acetylornithine deacetylase/succinyl-diaminopimelate desuccinylase-like protein
MYLHGPLPRVMAGRIGLIGFFILGTYICFGQPTAPQPDWQNVEPEILKHFQGLIRLDTTNPPGNETRAVEYIKRVLEAEKIPFEVFAQQEGRANLVARVRGNGAKRPILLMAHTDTVSVDAKLWKFPPFGGDKSGPHIYGRGTLDDKDTVAAQLMVIVLLKRLGVALERDVIFFAAAGEETGFEGGVSFVADQHWAAIDAEFCLAEGGSIVRRQGKRREMRIATTEKIPYGMRLVARGTAGHGVSTFRE